MHECLIYLEIELEMLVFSSSSNIFRFAFKWIRFVLQ